MGINDITLVLNTPSFLGEGQLKRTKIITLTTSFNRKDKTLNALLDLHRQKIPFDVDIEHVVVDDGSVDGTSDLISVTFPEVKVLKGTGVLFWAGGMRFGWEHYISKLPFDYLLVYNDDIRLNLDAVYRLIESSLFFENKVKIKSHVVVGSFMDEKFLVTTYGGLRHNSKLNPLSFDIISPDLNHIYEADTLNMNLALIKKEAIDLVGFLSSYFIHGGADFEFGLKLRKAGGAVVLAPGYFGVCNRNETSVLHSQCSKNLKSFFKARFSPKEAPPFQQFRYFSEHGNYFWLYFLLRVYLTKHCIKLFLMGRWF